MILSDEEKRALARVSVRDYPGNHGDWVPAWIGELAYGSGVSSAGAYDALLHEGLISWSDGWRVTEAGWRVLREIDPRSR